MAQAFQRFQERVVDGDMQIMQYIMMGIAGISGIVLILTVMLQTSKAESFSAMGGSDAANFKKGSREEMLDRMTKLAAIVWISSCFLNAVFYYGMSR